jgi:hypothetical protein
MAILSAQGSGQAWDEARKITGDIPVVGNILNTLILNPINDIIQAAEKKSIERKAPYPVAAQVFSPGV